MKERIESLEADNKGARERERAAAASKREVESLADSLRERLKLLEERAGVCAYRFRFSYRFSYRFS